MITPRDLLTSSLIWLLAGCSMLFGFVAMGLWLIACWIVAFGLKRG